MKYCLKYTNICTKLNRANEISIKYIEDKGLVDFMKKFSFGDEEKMIIGKRVIINAVVGYLIIQLIDLIIKFIEGIV